jgi:peptidoglycan/xylan/chitin deacetylase (PgdA/CDA1 family)
MLNIKSRLVQLVGPFGGFQLCRFLSLSTPKILMYHRFSENPQPGFVHREAFEKQIEYLKNNFNLGTLNDLVKTYRQQGNFPTNTIVITVDDGYSDLYEIAFPILKKYNVPATFFVTNRFVDGDFWLWPDCVRYILEHSNEIDLSRISSDLEYTTKQMTDHDRQAVWGMIITFLLSIAEDEKNHWLAKFAELQNVKFPDKPIEDYRAVSWSQVKELNASNIEIGVHTQSHPSLGRLKENQLSTEIQGAVEIIQSQIGKSPTSFCFPNGQPSDYTESVKQHVKDAGCQSAVRAFYDEHMLYDLFELRRFCVGTSWNYFLRAVNGVDVLAAKCLKTNNIMKSST